MGGGLPQASSVLDRVARRAVRGPEPEASHDGGLVALIEGRGYRLQERLGTGAMGAVFSAVQPLLDRTVAVKLQTYAHPDLAARAMREARVHARASHPNVLAVHDLIQAGDRLAVVLEHCPEGTLAERLQREGPLAPAEALDIARQTALALACVHRLGYVHRDMKPANLFFRDGLVKLGDFGLACPVRAEPTRDDRGGTAYYMAPEAWRGLATPQTDLHSLGVVLYEMIVGQRPFEGTTAREVAAKRLSGEPCPLVGALPDAERTLLASLLAFRAEDRPASAGAVAAAIESGFSLH